MLGVKDLEPEEPTQEDPLGSSPFWLPAFCLSASVCYASLAARPLLMLNPLYMMFSCSTTSSIYQREAPYFHFYKYHFASSVLVTY